MCENIYFSAEKFYLEAKKMLEEKDFIEFIAKISNAELLAESQRELLPDVTFLKVQGLHKFNQYRKALDNLPRALQYNSEGKNYFKLKNYEGVMLGHQGELKQAEEIFVAVAEQAQDDIELLIETLLNLVWLNLTINKDISEESLEKSKHYLDIVGEQIDLLADHYRWKLYNNLSIYYFHKDDYAKAIEMLEAGIKYCEEKELPNIYNNLAEIYLKSDQEAVSELVYKYTDMAEKIAERYKDDMALGNSYSTRAAAELREDQLFTAMDTLYLAFEYFKDAEAYTYAFDCLVKINELTNEYKIERLKSLKDSMIDKFRGTKFISKI